MKNSNRNDDDNFISDDDESDYGGKGRKRDRSDSTDIEGVAQDRSKSKPTSQRRRIFTDTKYRRRLLYTVRETVAQGCLQIIRTADVAVDWVVRSVIAEVKMRDDTVLADQQ